MNSESPKRNRFTKIMQMIFDTEKDEITCDECYQEVDKYVDLLRAGEDAGVLMPKIQHHLDHCPACQQELQALIDILENQTDI